MLAGGIAKCGAEVGFAKTEGVEQDEVGVFLDELEAEEVLDLDAGWADGGAGLDSRLRT